jgi:GNAT superfamily N-acetyltransferase
MRAPVPPRPERAEPQWSVRPVAAPGVDWYRALYRRVGGPYLWASRLALDDAHLAAILRDPPVAVFAFADGASEEGLLELDFRIEGECEIVYFGVTERFVGSGAGRFVMNRAVEAAWARPIRRLWLHTCTLDHPRAIPFYERSGFVQYKREIEIFADPRVTGGLPRDLAPEIPIFEGASGSS